MIIKRLTAVFGKLNNETLTLAPGLNIVEAPNESGKSTWSAFIRTMLYGVDTSDRDKAGYLSDKTRYRPWSGANMAGEMDIAGAMGDITLRRTSTGKAPMRDFKAVYTGTGQEVPGLTGEDAGETLTGVTEQVFRRSAFIQQSGVRFEQTPELEKRISALVSTGDETTSYTEADARLREWLRRRRFNKRGEIPALEVQLGALDDKLDALEAAAEKTAVLRSDIREAEREKEILTRELAYYSAQDREAEREKAARAERNMEAANEAAAELSSRLKAYGDPTADELAGLKGEVSALTSLRVMLDAERLRAEAAESEFAAINEKISESPLAGRDTARIASETEALERSVKTVQWMRWALLAALVVAGIVIITAGIGYITGTIVAIILIMPIGACALLENKWSRRRKSILKDCGVKTISDLRKRMTEFNALSDELRQAKETYAATEKVMRKAETLYSDARKSFVQKLEPLSFKGSEPDEVLKSLGDIEGVLHAYERAKSELSAAEKIYSALSPVSDAGKAPQMHGVKPRYSREETSAELGRVVKRLELCVSEYNIELGAQRALGDPVVLRSQRNETESRLSELSIQYDALTLAIETLGKANAEMQTRFSPLLSKTAEGLLSKLTDGKYEKLVFDRGFNASAKTPDDAVSRDALYLSAGTVDQAYLALRLAVSELLMPGADACPVILDDALASFDDVRTSNALRLLIELSERRQVILFTCHGREAGLLPDGAGVNIIRP